MKLPVTEVQRLHLDPGDKLVVLCEHAPGPAEADYIKDKVCALLQLGDDVPVLVLPAGMNVAVVTSP